jgi:hypothetical protein
MSDKVSGKPLFFKEKARYDILCHPESKNPNNIDALPIADNTAKESAGPTVALSSDVARDDKIISNAGTIVIPDEPNIPNEYEFEILRLRRRVESLECSIKDRDERNVQAIAMLEDELQMWRTFFHDHVAETHDGIRRRILRIESALMTLKTVTSRIVSSLEIPERWRKMIALIILYAAAWPG